MTRAVGDLRLGSGADQLGGGLIDELGHRLIDRLGDPFGMKAALLVVRGRMGMGTSPVVVAMRLGQGN